MTFLARVLMCLLACTSGSPPAHGTERPGEASIADALQDRTHVALALEREILALIETAPEESRLELYRTCNRLAGTWIQVDFTRAFLEFSMAATSAPEEAEIRDHLRSHARFALSSLDEATTDLEQNVTDRSRPQRASISAAIRSLLFEARSLVASLLADQGD